MREVARLPSSSLSLGGVVMVEIPENEDGLTALVLRTKTGVYGWLNACPHDGRRLCQDPVYLLNRKTGHMQCMHHQAVFEPDTGLCDDGPCRGENLTSLPVEEKNGEIVVFMNYL